MKNFLAIAIFMIVPFLSNAQTGHDPMTFNRPTSPTFQNKGLVVESVSKKQGAPFANFESYTFFPQTSHIYTFPSFYDSDHFNISTNDQWGTNMGAVTVSYFTLSGQTTGATYYYNGGSGYKYSIIKNSYANFTINIYTAPL